MNLALANLVEAAAVAAAWAAGASSCVVLSSERSP